MQLLYASQQPSNLAMVLNKMKGTKQPTYNVVKPIQQHRTAAFEGFHNVSSSKVGKKRKTRDVEDGAAGERTQDDDEAQVVHNFLRQQLQRERGTYRRTYAVEMMMQTKKLLMRMKELMKTKALIEGNAEI